MLKVTPSLNDFHIPLSDDAKIQFGNEGTVTILIEAFAFPGKSIKPT